MGRSSETSNRATGVSGDLESGQQVSQRGTIADPVRDEVLKAAVMNLLVNLSVGLQGNLGVGVEVVPVKQVPEYQAVILLEVNLGVVRMGKREIQQVVVDRMVGIFQAGEDFRLVEVFLAVEVARTISWCPRRSAWRWWSPWSWWLSWRTSWWRWWTRRHCWCSWRANAGVARWFDSSARINQSCRFT